MTVQLHMVLPVKAGVIAVALYYLFYGGWAPEELTVRWVVQETLQRFFQIYVGCNIVAAVVLMLWRRFPPGIFQWLVFPAGIAGRHLCGGIDVPDRWF